MHRNILWGCWCVYLWVVGAHATGKTTLARWIRDRFGLPMISEVARGVLAEMEAQVDSLRTNVELVNRYQAEVFERQIAAEEAQAGPFVSDRAFCNLAYAAQHSTILPEVFADPRLRRYLESVKRGVVLFLRPHQSLLVQDGVREALAWEEVLRIDGMVKFMLEMFGVPYVPVESLSMQERIRTAERVLTLAGLAPAVPQKRFLNGIDPRLSDLVRDPHGSGETRRPKILRKYGPSATRKDLPGQGRRPLPRQSRPLLVRGYTVRDAGRGRAAAVP